MSSQEPDAPLIERTSASATISAPIDRCYDVGIDLGAYPDWVEHLRSVEILERDDEGRPRTARFEAAGLGRMTSYILAYDLSQAPQVLAWSLVSGDLARAIEGRYRFQDATVSPGQPVTEVSYELTIDLKVPLPGFVKRRAEDKIVQAALDRFKLRVEELSGRV